MVSILKKHYRKKFDAAKPKTIEDYYQLITEVFEPRVVNSVFDSSTAGAFILSLATYHDKKFNQIAKGIVKENPVELSNAMQKIRIDQKIAENTRLIKGIPEKLYQQITNAVVKANKIVGYDQASLSREMHQLITEDLNLCFNKASTRAKLIARDQTNKTISILTETRHREIGITKYEWLGVDDERERESHLENNGKIFHYDDPPETGHPGQDYNCRCTQLGIFEAS